jgi:hypothetical protein
MLDNVTIKIVIGSFASSIEEIAIIAIEHRILDTALSPSVVPITFPSSGMINKLFDQDVIDT